MDGPLVDGLLIIIGPNVNRKPKLEIRKPSSPNPLPLSL